jgi:hypothetical protein
MLQYESQQFPEEEKKMLTEDIIINMKNGIPDKVSLNCLTFHIFTFYAMKDRETFVRMRDENYKPWKEYQNWKKYAIDETSDYKRYRAWGYYDMHQKLCFGNEFWYVNQIIFPADNHIELGIFARNDTCKYTDLSPTQVRHGLFGFLEYLNDESAKWYDDNHYPSSYCDEDITIIIFF